MDDMNLNPERIDAFIGFKMKPSEKLELEKFCEDEGFSVSRFCRHAVKKTMTDRKEYKAKQK